MGLIDGDLTGVDLRRDLSLVLAAAKDAADPTALVDALAEADPIALAEVVCGPRSPGGPALVRAALRHVPALEKALTPAGAWGRLVELAGAERGALLAEAARAWPVARWVVKLSRKVEGAAAGTTALVALAGRPELAEAARLHVEAGHREGVVAAAVRTGRPEPILALLDVDPTVAVRAIGAAYTADPDLDLLRHVAAAWGPDPDELFVRVVPHLRSRRAAEAFAAETRGLDATRRLLAVVLPTLPS